MPFYINTLLEAADIANIYELTPDELFITLTLVTCTDDAHKQELIKLDATSMQQVQDEVNKWETRMNTASRMLTKKRQRPGQAGKTTRNTGGRGDTQIHMLQVRRRTKAKRLHDQKGRCDVRKVQQTGTHDKSVPKQEWQTESRGKEGFPLPEQRQAPSRHNCKNPENHH